jgi:hypothetical protein
MDSDSEYESSFMEANQGYSSDEDRQTRNKPKTSRNPNEGAQPLGQLAPVRAMPPVVKESINLSSGPAMAKFNKIASEIDWQSDDFRSGMEGTDENLPMGTSLYNPAMDDDPTLQELFEDFTENAKELFKIDLNPASSDSGLPRYHIAPTEEAIMLRGQMPGLSVSLFDECIRDANVQRSASYSTKSRYRTINWREELKAFTPYMLVDRSGRHRIFCLSPSIYVDKTDPDQIITSELGMEIYEIVKVRVKSLTRKPIEKLECSLLGEVITHTKKTYDDLAEVLGKNFGYDFRSNNSSGLYEINVNYHAQRVLDDIPSLVFKLGPKSLLKADNALANIMGFVFGEDEGRINTQSYMTERGKAQLDSRGPRLYTWEIEKDLRKEQWRIDTRKRNAEKKLERERREKRQLAAPGNQESESEISEDGNSDYSADNYGGKKRRTKKCRTKKRTTKSHKTQKYRTKKCRTKKYRTKKYRTKKK